MSIGVELALWGITGHGLCSLQQTAALQRRDLSPPTKRKTRQRVTKNMVMKVIHGSGIKKNNQDQTKHPLGITIKTNRYHSRLVGRFAVPMDSLWAQAKTATPPPRMGILPHSFQASFFLKDRPKPAKTRENSCFFEKNHGINPTNHKCTRCQASSF